MLISPIVSPLIQYFSIADNYLLTNDKKLSFEKYV